MIGRSALCVTLAGMLAACSSGAVREEVEQKAQRIEQDLDRAREPIPAYRSNPLVVTDKVWTGSQAVRLHHGVPLPGRLETGRGISLVSAANLTLEDISGLLTAQIGIPVRLGPGAPTGKSSANTPVPVRGTVAMPSGSSGSDSDAGSMNIAYEGSLSGLLDQVAAHYGVNWNYDGTTIAFSKFETRVFVLEAMPGKGKYSDKTESSGGSSSGSSGGGSSGGSSGGSGEQVKQELELQADLDVWSEIGNTINAILGGTGSAVISPTVGSVTVTTTPDIMKNVARYIADQNQRLVRQVAINIDVYTADVENEDDITNKLDLALKAIKPFTLTGVAVPALGSNGGNTGNLTIGIIDNPTITADSVLKAISSVSNNVRVAKFPMTTLNNVPITRRVGRDIAFLASSATTTTGTSGTSTTTLTPGTLREGFSIQITPRLLADSRILLQYSLNLVDLIRISSFTSGSSSVQLPETTTRSFIQQSMLRSGSTLILAGFSQEQTQQNANGTLDPYNILLGGGIGNNKKKSLLLIAITPQELDVPPLEQP